MDIVNFINTILSDYTFRTVAAGAAILGIVNGTLGSFAVLRKQSLLGDAISHAALPGIAIAFLLSGSKAPLIILLGAAAAGWTGTLLIMSIVNNTRIKYDTALGLILSVFFGLGLVLLTHIQKMPVSAQAGLDTFLFGQAASLIKRDVVTMGGVGILALAMMILLWKEFKLVTFDPDYGSSLGLPMRVLDITLTSLLVTAIVIGLQTVGVVLMSTMVIAPAAAARQWTDRLGVMVCLSGFFGALAGVSGSLISSTIERMPTGPTIVLCISAIALISIFLAPNRGLAWRWAREQLNRRQLQSEAVLYDLYILARTHENPFHSHRIEVLRTMSIGHGGVDRSLKDLEEKGFATGSGTNDWALTRRGLDEARRIFEEKENMG